MNEMEDEPLQKLEKNASVQILGRIKQILVDLSLLIVKNHLFLHFIKSI